MYLYAIWHIMSSNPKLEIFLYKHYKYTYVSNNYKVIILVKWVPTIYSVNDDEGSINAKV